MKLKVCGMKYQDNIDNVATLQPDYLGLIFYDKSPRYVNTELSSLPKHIKKTGVFVNASFEQIIEKVQAYQLQVVQLHGNESPEFCLELKQRYKEKNDKVISSKHTGLQDFKGESYNDNTLEIIKVFSIKDNFDFSVLQTYESVCDYYLFDTKGKQPGGNGYAFDWSVLKDYPSTKPYFLSGGIGLGETEQLQQFLNSDAAKYCYAIDVNSRFEIEAGLKNIKDLEKFKQSLSFRT